MIIERRVQFGLVELVMSLTSGWEDNTEEWWWGVSWMLFSVGVFVVGGNTGYSSTYDKPTL